MSDNFDQVSNSYEADINNPEFGEEGKSKKSTIRAISNADQALQIAQRLVHEDADRDFRRARNLAAFNGEAPYSDRDLRDKGQAYRYNVSFGFMEGVIGRGVVPYNELTLNLDNLAAIEADLDEKKVQIIREKFIEVLKNWGKWAKFITRLNQELVLNGYLSPIFPNTYDPWPIFIAQKDGFVHSGATNDAPDLEVFVWRKRYLIHELYGKIEDDDTATKVGWNVPNVRQALMAAKPMDKWTQGGTLGSTNWSAVEEAIRGGSLFNSIVGAKMIETYHVFATELSGKVSHFIVLADSTLANVDNASEKTELFKKFERFESMSELLVYFDLEAGDGNWHGSRGLAQRSFNTHRAIDKLRCSVLDQTFASGLTIIQPGDQVSQEEFQLTVMGPFAVIPAGIEISATTVPAVATTTFQTDNLLTATSEQRIGDVVPSSQSLQTGDSKTATEAKITAGRAAAIGKSNLQRYIDPLSQLLSIMLRKLIKKNSPNKYAKDFQEALKKKGISRDDLDKIRGARSTGRIDEVLGDTAAVTQVAFTEFRNDPDVNQLELKRKRLGSLVGPKDADDLLIPETDDTIVLEADRMQREEIGTIIVGIPVPPSPRDNQEVHVKVCIDWLGGQAQNMSQGKPGASFSVIQGVIEHAQGHVKFLMADPVKKDLAKTVEKDLKSLIDLFGEIQRRAQEIAAQNEQAPVEPPQQI